jgi:hypothetical protein
LLGQVPNLEEVPGSIPGQALITILFCQFASHTVYNFWTSHPSLDSLTSLILLYAPLANGYVQPFQCQVTVVTFDHVTFTYLTLPPMARKKRRFLEDDDADDNSDVSRGSDNSDQKARDWAKAPAFVSGAEEDLNESMVVDESVPAAFAPNHAQRAFLQNVGSASSSRPETPLSAPERAHFNKISGSLGARMLAKMGWEAGTGLGVTGEGIVTPVESKIRPQKMGIAFRGFKEKTEQSKAEAIRRGEVVSDDERKGDKKPGAEKAKRSDAWRKPKKIKVKVEHKSYEEILAEVGQASEAPNIGQIIDATGATVSLQRSVIL